MLSKLVALFNETLGAQYETRLQGGADEPFYKAGPPATIFFRHDYVRSCLHETAHWCIAGDERRKLDDFGYWYAPDGRDAAAQLEFEKVEVRPQALEALFCEALEIPFSVSLDNLDNPSSTSTFERAVFAQAEAFRKAPLSMPPRGHHWCRLLKNF